MRQQIHIYDTFCFIYKSERLFHSVSDFLPKLFRDEHYFTQGCKFRKFRKTCISLYEMCNLNYISRAFVMYFELTTNWIFQKDKQFFINNKYNQISQKIYESIFCLSPSLSRYMYYTYLSLSRRNRDRIVARRTGQEETDEERGEKGVNVAVRAWER